jgi:hypothetical protein
MVFQYVPPFVPQIYHVTIQGMLFVTRKCSKVHACESKLIGILTTTQKQKDDEGEEGLYSYDETFIRRVIAIFSIIISSALPTASIFALFFIDSQIFRLVFVLIFSFIFSSALAIFTSANRVEIFTAVVAMASVQVVFIGTSGPPSGS